MRYRTFGRLGWRVSEVGYGMWGLAAWSGSDEAETREALSEAVRLGCNFFDTAWAYGRGRSERFLGELVRGHRDQRLYTATKIPPKNFTWPSRPEFSLDDAFPPDLSGDTPSRASRTSASTRSISSSSTCGRTHGRATNGGNALSMTSAARGSYTPWGSV
jgi:aryl-alcohol dehydrogenase-like predicted oxidoreductase